MLVKHNNNSISALTSAGQLAQGKMTLISEQTASSSNSISFTSGIDSIYPIYRFEFINIHPQIDDVDFKFQGSTDNGSTYATSITSTWFESYHDEADTGTSLAYNTGRDQANGTALQFINNKLGNDNDQSSCVELILYSPSDTTFVKHFLIRTIRYSSNNFQAQQYCAGYFNTTSAVTNLKFQMSSGNIDDGIIKMYGVS